MIKTIGSELVCVKCGSVFPIMRRASNQKSTFHKKYLYCINCKKKTKHIEAKDLDLLIATMEHKEKSSLTQEEKKVYQLVKSRREKI